MPQLDLFDDHDPADDRPELAARLAPRLADLARRGVWFGTSSWKYPGWLGSIYSPSRYEVRGKLSQKRFDTQCLREYAETFPLVGGDFSFYQFPSASYWDRLFGESPASLQFALKVPEHVTVARWPGHARYGKRAGTDNPDFLDPRVLRTLLLRPLRPHADRVAALMLEFGTFAKSVFGSVSDFLARLTPLLDAMADEPFRLAVEIRNPEYLGPAYFDALAQRNVAHLFNAWTRMPELVDQIARPDAHTADFLIARALLARGRAYDDAVQAFEPYDHIQEPNPRAREALRHLAEMALDRKKPAFLLVNNRLEGHAPGTIEAVVESLPLSG
jgi:uncharacterized protein YecE (DUF72 family)